MYIVFVGKQVLKHACGVLRTTCKSQVSPSPMGSGDWQQASLPVGPSYRLLKKRFVWLVGWYTPCTHVQRSEDNPWKLTFFFPLCGFQGSNCGP